MTEAEWAAWWEETYTTLLADTEKRYRAAQVAVTTIRALPRQCVLGTRDTAAAQEIVELAAQGADSAQAAYRSVRDFGRAKGLDYVTDLAGRAGIALHVLVTVNLPAMEQLLVGKNCNVSFDFFDAKATLLELAAQPIAVVEQQVQAAVEAAAAAPTDEEAFITDLVQLYKDSVPSVERAVREFLDANYVVVDEGREAAVMLARHQGVPITDPVAVWRFEEVQQPPNEIPGRGLTTVQYQQMLAKWGVRDTPELVEKFKLLRLFMSRWTAGTQAYSQIVKFFDGKSAYGFGGDAEYTIQQGAAAHRDNEVLQELVRLPWGQRVFDERLRSQYRDPRLLPPDDQDDQDDQPKPTLTPKARSSSLLPALLLGAGGFAVAGPVGAAIGLGVGVVAARK